MPELWDAGDDISRFLSGKELIGEELSEEQAEKWLEDEREAFTDMYVSADSYSYGYHALNALHCYRYLPDEKFYNVLGVGAATGDEFLPIISRVARLTIVEPSSHYEGVSSVHGCPVTYVKPERAGALPFEEERFDLVTAFGVLHHLPKVSSIVADCARCLAPGGWMLIREPIISMGDWRLPRAGLTRRERGIPVGLLKQFAIDAGLTIQHSTLCQFAPMARIGRHFSIPVNDRRALVLADSLLSWLFMWNYRYHANGFWGKLRPTCVSLVLRKQ